jgi:hypothetical protein
MKAVQQLLNYTLCLFCLPLFSFLQQVARPVGNLYLTSTASMSSRLTLLHQGIPWCFRHLPGSFGDVCAAHISQSSTVAGWLNG